MKKSSFFLACVVTLGTLFFSSSCGDPADEPEIYTVTFNSNGGSTVDSVTVEEGNTISEPIDPTKAGYVFDGWYEDANLTIAFDFI